MRVDRRIVWAVFVLVFTAVLYAIFRPTPPEMIFEHSDKVRHVLAFFGLGFMARLALFRLPRWLLWWALLTLAFGLEYLQGEFRPLRIFSLEDAYVNAAGVVITFACFQFTWKKPS